MCQRSDNAAGALVVIVILLIVFICGVMVGHYGFDKEPDGTVAQEAPAPTAPMARVGVSRAGPFVYYRDDDASQARIRVHGHTLVVPFPPHRSLAYLEQLDIVEAIEVTTKREIGPEKWRTVNLATEPGQDEWALIVDVGSADAADLFNPQPAEIVLDGPVPQTRTR